MRDLFEEFLKEEGLKAVNTFAEDRCPTWWRHGAPTPTKVLDYICVPRGWEVKQFVQVWMWDGTVSRMSDHALLKSEVVQPVVCMRFRRCSDRAKSTGNCEFADFRQQIMFSTAVDACVESLRPEQLARRTRDLASPLLEPKPRGDKPPRKSLEHADREKQIRQVLGQRGKTRDPVDRGRLGLELRRLRQLVKPMRNDFTRRLLEWEHTGGKQTKGVNAKTLRCKGVETEDRGQWEEAVRAYGEEEISCEAERRRNVELVRSLRIA